MTQLRPQAALAALALALIPAAAAAQATPTRVTRDVECHNGSDRDAYCELREYTLQPRESLEVSGGANGGITVTGWDRNEIRLVARVQARSDDDARALADAIAIRTGSEIEADGPRTWGRHESWAVSFELRVPRRTALHLKANNGGIGLTELTGDVEARTTNGAIHLLGGAGRVRGETTNGALRIELTGQRWEGDGLQLETTNGSVRIAIPADYSARLETGTVNGGFRLDIPVTVQGRLHRTLRTELGDGGSLIRATTTNGRVVIARR